MGWIQCKTPITDDKKLIVYDSEGKPMNDWYGWCLAVTQQAFGINLRKYGSALECWNASKTKHTDGGMNIPIGYYVPVFYTDNKYGHVVICYRPSYEKVCVWSSPLTHKPYFDYFEGDPVQCLDYVGKKYGCKYAGWMEILTETRIIQWVEDALEQHEKEQKESEEKLDELIEQVEKPVEKCEPSGNKDVENSDMLIVRIIKSIIEFLRGLIS